MTYKQINKVRQDLTAHAYVLIKAGCPENRLMDELHSEWTFWEMQPAMSPFEKLALCYQVASGFSIPAVSHA